MSLEVPEEYSHADLFGALRDPLSFIVSVAVSISIHHGITFEEQIDPSVFQCY